MLVGFAIDVVVFIVLCSCSLLTLQKYKRMEKLSMKSTSQKLHFFKSEFTKTSQRSLYRLIYSGLKNCAASLSQSDFFVEMAFCANLCAVGVGLFVSYLLA